jgi:hypothetical protein
MERDLFKIAKKNYFANDLGTAEDSIRVSEMALI